MATGVAAICYSCSVQVIVATGIHSYI
jgi:hypothetical protein